MLRRFIIPTLSRPSAAFFSLPARYFWLGPKKPEATSPGAIIGLLLGMQHFSVHPKDTHFLANYLTGEDRESLCGPESTSPYSSFIMREIQIKRNPYSKIALVLRFPELYRFAKEYKNNYHAMQQDTLQQIQPFFLENMKVFLDKTFKTDIITKDIAIEDITLSVDMPLKDHIERRFKKNICLSVEKMFGKEVMITPFNDSELKKINYLGKMLREHGVDITDFDIEKELLVMDQQDVIRLKL